jgi:hypothetical protein
VSSLFWVDCVDGADVVVASCEFEPNNWLNLLAIPEPEDEPGLDEEPNMLPPPQPDKAEPATTTSAIPAARFKSLPAIVLPLDPKIRDGPYSRAKAAIQRRKIVPQ